MNRFMTTGRAIPASVFTAALLAAPASAAGSAQGIVYIYAYNGASSAYQVASNGKTETAAPFLPLLDGDRITIATPKDQLGNPSIMTLSINGRLVQVDHSPYCIGKSSGDCNGANAPTGAFAGMTSQALMVFKSVLASISGIFGQAQDDSYSSLVDQMVSRGPGTSAPQIPMLPASPMPIEPASSTLLAFQWLGGKTPFTVTVVPARGNTPLVTKTGIAQNNVTIEGLHLAPGTYQVHVTDSLQQTVSGTFNCVNQPLPPLPIDSISNDLAIPPATLAALRAGLYAKQGTEYYLVAYQALADFPDDPPNGQVHNLRNWLAEGLPFSNFGQ
jgi:hypothetical protein